MPIDTSTHCIVKREHSDDIPALFQEWGRSVTYDGGNNPIPITIAIVIVKATGEVLEVEPHRIQFVSED